jgi:hypothetical protein
MVSAVVLVVLAVLDLPDDTIGHLLELGREARTAGPLRSSEGIHRTRWFSWARTLIVASRLG